MKEPKIEKSMVTPLLDRTFLRVFDLKYAPQRRYCSVTRRTAEELVAIKSDKEFASMLPDAVTCCVVLKLPQQAPKLLLTYEYRYPAGRFLLSIPAGLIDEADKCSDNPLLSAARREIAEETGIELGPYDRLFVVNPLLFSSPGMTDESNAIICAVAELESDEVLSQSSACGTEIFDGFLLADRDEALEILRSGRDPRGNYYPAYTWIALSYFVSGAWAKETP